RLMSYIKQIKGNRTLTSLALSLILQKEVTSLVKNINKKFKGEEISALGNGRLGFVTTVHNDYDDTSIWEFTINVFNENELALYNINKPMGQLINRFKELYIP